MRQPENLGLLKEKEYAVLGTASTDSSTRRQLARRREWFNTDEQFLQYLLIIEALEIELIAERDDDGDGEPIEFSWDIAQFGDFDLQIKLYYARDGRV